MENQHRRIIHERELEEKDINKLNKIRGVATVVKGLIETYRDDDDLDQKLVSLARTQLETGFMYLEKSVNRPTTGL